jgi:hypothetical protein
MQARKARDPAAGHTSFFATQYIAGVKLTRAVAAMQHFVYNLFLLLSGHVIMG